MTESQGMERNRPMPLEGILVVEYAVFHAGPGAGAILGDLGAEVIKIESGTGDPVRYWTRIADVDIAMANGQSLMYEISNRNKTGVCLDIKTEAGREVFHRLIRKADVFLTNLRQSTKEDLGIDYETLRQINPELVHANVSGFGPQGPMSDQGGFDPLGQAVSGLTFTTGAKEPLLMHLGVLDQTTAIAASHAILSALLYRERQGAGQEVHVSLYSTGLWMQHPNLVLDSVLQIDPCMQPIRSAHSPLRNRFCCQDGRWIIGTHHPEEKYWPTFCHLTGLPEILEDPKFTDEGGRPRPGPELMEKFDRVFATRPRDEWIQIFLEGGLMFAPVRHVSEVKSDPQALANRYVTGFSHPRLGEIDVPGYPVGFSGCRAGTHRPAPDIGEHTDAVLERLGYDRSEIDALKESGTVRQAGAAGEDPGRSDREGR